MNTFKSLLIASALVSSVAASAQAIIAPHGEYLTLKCEEVSFQRMAKYSLEVTTKYTEESTEEIAKIYRQTLAGENELVKAVAVKRDFKNKKFDIDPTMNPELAVEGVQSIGPSMNFKGEDFSLVVHTGDFNSGYISNLSTMVKGKTLRRTLLCDQIMYAF